SGRMASPYPMADFHLLFFASFPGALRVGSIADVRLGCEARPLTFRQQTSRVVDSENSCYGTSRPMTAVQSRSRSVPMSGPHFEADCIHWAPPQPPGWRGLF